jgi:hypothetical protein
LQYDSNNALALNCTAIFQNDCKQKLSLNPPLSVNAGELGPRCVEALPDSNELKGDIVAAYVDSLRMMWIVMCLLASVALLLTLIFVKDISL